MSDTDTGVDETAAAAESAAKPSKADRLMAKAERAREREAQRAAQLAARAEQPAARRRTGWAITVVSLGVAVVVLAALLAVSYVQLGSRDDALARARPAQAANDNRAAAQTAARAWAAKFGSYDYRHLTSDFAATTKYMTPSFASSYTKTSQALAKTFVAYKTQVTATVPTAAVVTSGPSSATVLVLLDQVIRSTQTTTPKINRNRLMVQLQLSKGRWLVSKTDAV